METNPKAVEYLVKVMPNLLNEIGGAVQDAIYEAYCAGQESERKPRTYVVSKFRSTTMETAEYVLAKDGLYYHVDSNSFLSEIGFDRSKFAFPEFKPVEVINTKGLTIALDQQVTYEGKDYVVFGISNPQMDTYSALRVSIGPSVDKFISGEKGATKVVDIDEVS